MLSSVLCSAIVSRYNWNMTACALVVFHDFLDHLDGIVAKVQRKVYGPVDDPVLGGYLDAVCDKVGWVESNDIRMCILCVCLLCVHTVRTYMQCVYCVYIYVCILCIFCVHNIVMYSVCIYIRTFICSVTIMCIYTAVYMCICNVCTCT